MGTGLGSTKKEAEEKAAKQALIYLNSKKVKKVLIPKGIESTFIHSLPESATAALAANLLVENGHSIAILVEESMPKAEEWGEDIAVFIENLQTKGKVEFYLFDNAPKSNHPDAFDKICDRSTVLSSLLRKGKKDSDIILISTTPEALTGRCTKYEQHIKTELTLTKGQEYDFNNLCTILATDFDYSSEILCEEAGQFSIRGGLIDIYPINETKPFRIDFFGNEIEEIRSFNPTTQRSEGAVDQLIVSSAKSNEEEECEGGFFEYLNQPVTWIFREPEQLAIRFPMVFHSSEKKQLDKPVLQMHLGEKMHILINS